MASDFLHTEAIIEALLAQIEANAPAAWFADGDPENLQLCEFGDCREYAIRDASLADDCPAILVRPLNVDEEGGKGGISGVIGTRENLRVVMARTWDQTLDDDGDVTTLARGKARYMKLLSKAIFADYHLGNPALTTDDHAASVLIMTFEGADYGEGDGDARAINNLGARLWAISIDVAVTCRTGP